MIFCPVFFLGGGTLCSLAGGQVNFFSLRSCSDKDPVGWENVALQSNVYLSISNNIFNKMQIDVQVHYHIVQHLPQRS